MENHTVHTPAMFSDATLPAQTPCSVYHSTSDLTTLDSYGYDFLGKRCTTLNHCTLYPSTKHLDNIPCSLKKQTFAMQVNTRHMVPPSTSMSHHQHDASVPTQSSINQPHALEEFQSNTDGENITSINENLSLLDTYPASQNIPVQSMNNHAAGSSHSTICLNVESSTPSNMQANISNKVKPATHTSQRQKHKPYSPFLSSKHKTQKPLAILPRASSSTLNQSTDNHHVYNGTKAQMRRTQRWIDALEQIFHAHRQPLYVELFGDIPDASPVPDLLALLKEIDQGKNQVSLQEQQATHIMEAVAKVRTACNAQEQECIRIADGIFHNFHQRFSVEHSERLE
ncbi:hypothetical protein V8E55_001715 [Tylopilus felleus]